MKRGSRCTLAVLSLVALCSDGCVSSGKLIQRASASHLAATATSYNLAIEQAQDEMLLMNVIRAKDHSPMYITDASKVTGTVKLDLSLGLKIPVHVAAPDNDLVIMPNIDYSTSPAMDVNLLNAQDFMDGFLSPIPQDFFAYYWDQGWPAEFLLNLLVLRVDVYESKDDPLCRDSKPQDLSYQERAEAEKKAEYEPLYSPTCSVSNHPDVFDSNYTQWSHFSDLINSQLTSGRPRLESVDAQNAKVGPPLVPLKLDELVTVANADGLSLRAVEPVEGIPDKQPYQLRQSKKIFSLVLSLRLIRDRFVRLIRVPDRQESQIGWRPCVLATVGEREGAGCWLRPP